MKIQYKCKHCSDDIPLSRFIRNNRFKFCNGRCYQDYNYAQRIRQWKAGEIIGTRGITKQLCNWLRKYLLEKYNYSCVKCGWCKRHPVDNLPLVEVNHIDGDADNCTEENLEVICPNCHSETPNFRARNKQSARNRVVPPR